MPPDISYKVLLVNDEITTQKILDIVLKQYDSEFLLNIVSEYSKALEIMVKNTSDIYVIDYHLAINKTGVELYKEAVKNGCIGPAILLTGDLDENVQREALDADFYDIMIKNENVDKILPRTIRYAYKNHTQKLKELREKRKLDRIVSNIPGVLYEIQANPPNDYLLTFVSPQIINLTGRQVANVNDYVKVWESCVHPEDLEVYKHHRNILYNGGKSTLQYRIIKTDGSVLYVNDRAVSYHNGIPKITCYGLITDVTDRVTLENQLNAEREQNKKLESDLYNEQWTKIINILKPTIE